jgi:hypothetical protein
MNDTVINGLAVIGAIACVIWLIKGIKALSANTQSSDVATTPTQAGVAINPANDDIAVIASAVYAMLGSHRIVHIEDASKGHLWAAEGRWMHQTSHNPHP